MSAGINVEQWPPGKEVVTPTLTIKTKKLEMPAIVQLPIFCHLEDENEELDLIQINMKTSEWKVTDHIPVKNSKISEFECKESGHYVATIPPEQSHSVTYMVRPIIYYQNNNFVVALIRDTELDISTLLKTMQQDYPIGLTTKHLAALPCQTNQTIVTCIKCVEPENGFCFTQNGTYSHGIREIIHCSIASYRLCTLSSEEPKMRIRLQCELLEDGKPLREADCFEYCWEPGKSTFLLVLLFQSCEQYKKGE